MIEQTQEQAVILKPCPFCGGEAEQYQDGDMEGWSVTALHNTGCPLDTFAYETQAAANEAWNRRPSPSQAFDSGLWQEVRERVEDMRLACTGERELCDVQDDTECLARLALECEGTLKLLDNPSPPAPDIAQIRARFEAIYPCPEVLRGPGYSQWLARFDGYCAALGVKP